MSDYQNKVFTSNSKVNRGEYLFSSESVSEGHPDKIADQISDAVLDAYLSRDPNVKVACECLITNQHVVIAGEIYSSVKLDETEIARQTIRSIGYDNEEIGFNYATAVYTNLIHQQSREINESVAEGGAGDQGLMFGYACNETIELMPLPISLAHKLVRRQAELRKSGALDWLLPDAKSQVTIRYGRGKPVVENVVLSTQHRFGINTDDIHHAVIERIIKPVIEKYIGEKEPEYIINPSGSFTIGGPKGDTGLTGRKIIVDTYGGSCPHGGGAFSGKDPSKVDRSAAYAARSIAKHVVASGIGERCTVQFSYAIGRPDPVSLFVYLHGTGRSEEPDLQNLIPKLFDLRPNGIIKTFGLKLPIYSGTSTYGHFGKAHLPWEVLDANIIRELNPML